VEEQTDKTFIKNISIVLAILIVFTFSIAFLARDIGFKDDSANNPSRQTTAEERIKPVADVYTGEAGAAAIAQAASSSSAQPKVAFDGSLDGGMLYTSVCSACHATGAAGAPKPGSPEWAARAGKGLDALVQSAVNGLNAMPARGGRSDLSDEQVQVIVEFMLK
jgi:cytochrome c5